MSAYSLYEVLLTLIDRVGWPTEEEKRVCQESVREAQRMGIFGNLASDMVCNHSEVIPRSGRCADCGRIIAHKQ